MVLVPHQAGKTIQPDIILSLSTFYPALTMLKDLTKLAKSEIKGMSPFKRLTAIPLQLEAFESDLYQLLIRRVTLDNLENHFGFTKGQTLFEVALIEKVLDSPETSRMRDLPAYFLASTSMQSTIQKYLALKREIPAKVDLRDTLLAHNSQPELKGWIAQTIEQYGFSIEHAKNDLLKSVLVADYLKRNAENLSSLSFHIDQAALAMVLT